MLNLSPSEILVGGLFLFHDQATVGDYTYAGYVGKDGDWLIARYKTDDSETRYAGSSGGYFTAWATKTLLDYNYFCNL